MAGLPLPVRAVLSAQHAGIEEILIVGGTDPAGWLPTRAQTGTHWLPGDPPNEISALRQARAHLGEPFLVLFADSVVEPAALAGLRGNPLDGRLLLRVEPQTSLNGLAASVFVASSQVAARLDRMADSVGTLEELWARLPGSEASATRAEEGASWERTTARRRLARIERELHDRSLKPTDGLYARFNKKVVAWPLTYLFLRTPATPNFITGLGLVLGLLSGVALAMGGYRWSVFGALLAYASAIMDHVDGMVARLKFQQTDWGTWFETAVDYASYFALFVGMAIGLWRETRAWYYLLLGALFIFGSVAAFVVQSRQRRQLSRDRPGDYIRRIHAKAEEHSENFLYWFGRRCYFVVRRAFLPYFILLLCLLNLRGFLLGWVALGVNLFWVLLLYSNRLLAASAPPKSR